MHRVLIVEDDPATLKRIRDVVAAHADFDVCGVAMSVAQGKQQLAACTPDVLLSDLGLPDGSGLDLIRQVSDQHPQVEIMVVTTFGDEVNVLAAIEAGATGYLLKDAPLDSIPESITDLIDGGSPISPAIARHVLRRMTANSAQLSRASAIAADPVDSPLTPKETQVLQQIAKGYTYHEIASTLGVSFHTVGTHVKNIYRKLSVKSRGEAVFEAVQLGIIEVADRHGRN